MLPQGFEEPFLFLELPLFFGDQLLGCVPAKAWIFKLLPDRVKITPGLLDLLLKPGQMPGWVWRYLLMARELAMSSI